jgi:hypothetical protein
MGEIANQISVAIYIDAAYFSVKIHQDRVIEQTSKKTGKTVVI